MRIVIVEDERMIAERLRRLVTEIVGDRLESLTLLDRFSLAREHLATHPIDLLFLDLDLYGRDGFGLLEEALASSFATIVVSAHHDQALRAFELGVTDFVPKPFGRDRLAKSLARLETREPALRKQLQNLAVRTRRGIDLVPVARVRYLQGADDYTALHLVGGQRRLHPKSLRALETLLPSPFTRVHRSFIVNLARVRSLESHGGGKHRIILDDGTDVPVSRARIAALRQDLRMDDS